MIWYCNSIEIIETNHENKVKLAKINSCSHVIIRHEVYKTALRPFYERPFHEVEHNQQEFLIQRTDRTDFVHLDQLKSAFTYYDLDLTVNEAVEAEAEIHH